MITYIFSIIYYTIIASINKFRGIDVVVVLIMSLLIVLEYSMSVMVFNDILMWLTIMSVVDVVLLTVFCFGYNWNKTLLVICIVSILCTIWNMLSYVNIKYYIDIINSIITNNYLTGLLLFINVENKWLNWTLKLLLIGASFI